jgi:hypothetical protein
MKLLNTKDTFATAASKAGMDEKTARKYCKLAKLPSEIAMAHTWRTREDPFEGVWDGVQELLEINPGLEAKSLFKDLQRRYPGRFSDGQLRTLQRRIKIWRALEGPSKEVFFPQIHYPGQLCQSDFTDMKKLGVTIEHEPFDHLIYHFVLTYSNWEAGSICFSESFESLSEGLQNALWELGSVPKSHRTDCLTAAVQKTDHPEEFTQRYTALLKHYVLEGQKTQVSSPNENGDVEQRHYRFKKAVDQALMLRGSRDFESRDDYADFLKNLFGQLNAGRHERLAEELKVLSRLPQNRLDSCQQLEVKVGPSSTIRVKHNVYSVFSRLIGESVNVRLYAEHLEIWYAQRLIETIPRLRGENKHRINYRHIIDWLVRKPGAFENYRYHGDLFPSHRFRVAYDALKMVKNGKAAKEYIEILYLAARESETGVDAALGILIDRETPVTVEGVKALLDSSAALTQPTEVNIAPVDLASYDSLLGGQEVEQC